MTGEGQDRVFALEGEAKTGAFVLVCEHASWFIPSGFKGLGLSETLKDAHISWDPGALELARALAERLESPLFSGTVSRLVYDCNRPPEADDAVPQRSEVYDVPGNIDLDREAKAGRAKQVYYPFHAALEALLSSRETLPVLVTVHSFTPVYRGQSRAVEIGILHDEDKRLADAMLVDENLTSLWKTERNSPYGPEDGVTHTLKKHALPRGMLNVMLEIRNDLITTPAACAEMADQLAECLLASLARCRAAEDAR
ncbi:N-formylglutamate amidohydrolase [Rhodobacteraceae bacterium D3-12]|nr:N-formylglutamate amidohydrolase [Rhodobacteraceae bacterium D3-12]